MKSTSSSTAQILKAFIPYSRENSKLVYKPKLFFNNLEAKSKVKERTLRSAYYRSVKSGLIKLDDNGVPRLTDKGVSKIKVYKSTKLRKNSHLLISFDVPEAERFKRDHLRTLLRELSCTKIQQSLWATKYDHRPIIAAEIKEYGLENYVAIYEAVKLPT